jgi:hypothetical protein
MRKIGICLETRHRCLLASAINPHRPPAGAHTRCSNEPDDSLVTVTLKFSSPLPHDTNHVRPSLSISLQLLREKSPSQRHKIALYASCDASSKVSVTPASQSGDRHIGKRLFALSHGSKVVSHRSTPAKSPWPRNEAAARSGAFGKMAAERRQEFLPTQFAGKQQQFAGFCWILQDSYQCVPPAEKPMLLFGSQYENRFQCPYSGWWRRERARVCRDSAFHESRRLCLCPRPDHNSFSGGSPTPKNSSQAPTTNGRFLSRLGRGRWGRCAWTATSLNTRWVRRINGGHETTAMK